MEYLYYNTLNVFYNGDYHKLKKARAAFGAWEAAWKKVSSEARLDPHKEWKELEARGIRLILQEDKEFPPLLREIATAPFGLYIKGESLIDIAPKIGIVGTRKATSVGKSMAESIAGELALSGITVVSGLATGIDAAAHSATVKSSGKTVAVLAHGLDQVYPRHHSRLAEEILSSGGALVSEYPLGPVAYAARFLERNRIISGLSLGVVVVEAPESSGSLATARFAMEQNREVFVVPGMANHLNYAGSHALLRDGARLVCSAKDVLEDLGLMSLEKEVKQKKFGFLNPAQSKIVEAMRSLGATADIDSLCEISKIDISELNQNLTLLLIQGVIKEEAGRYFLS
ncbi:MAG: DNA-processing protein DprA, partial [Patescibacteria group bacterium]